MCDPSTVHLENNNFKAIIKGTEHNSFADHGILKGKISVFKAKGWHLGAGDTDASSYQTEMIHLIQSFFDKFLKNQHVDLMQLNSDVITAETYPFYLRHPLISGAGGIETAKEVKILKEGEGKERSEQRGSVLAPKPEHSLSARIPSRKITYWLIAGGMAVSAGLFFLYCSSQKSSVPDVLSLTKSPAYTPP